MRQAAHFEEEFPGASRSASEVLLNLARTSSVTLAELDRRHKEAIGRLSLSGWQALAVIDGAGEPLPPTVIGERLLLTSGSITSLLDTLERRGLVRREPHPDDRRKLLVDITDKARTLVDPMLAQVHATSMDVTAGISEADREHLIQTLAKLRANAEAMGARPVPPVTVRRRPVHSLSRRGKRGT
ncbi:MAG TPA: MarR family transcriptional regulator [Candidatus Saccharimonadales bacterium]|nr:MarR family transcriptional regulator [Candidatus Saccharimonadales bacterium]